MSLTAEEWNALYPVGTPVVAYPMVRPNDPLVTEVRRRQAQGLRVSAEDLEMANGIPTKTCSAAWTFSHGVPVVMVEGYAGGIQLPHIYVLPEPVAGRS